MAERDTGTGRGDGPDPVDEDAAWAAIVAGYGEEPPDPDLSVDSDGDADTRADADGGSDPTGEERARPGGADPADRPLGSSITVFGAGIGPRDWTAAEPSDDDLDASDEGHFEPPEPPPLPQADLTARFAWIAVLGGPLLLVLTVLLQWNMTWWIATLGIGGFLGGLGTLFFRMNDGDDDQDDDPGRGAVV